MASSTIAEEEASAVSVASAASTHHPNPCTEQVVRKKRKTSHDAVTSPSTSDVTNAPGLVTDISHSLASNILSSIVSNDVSAPAAAASASHPVPVQLECDSDMDCGGATSARTGATRKRRRQQRKRAKLPSDAARFVDELTTNILTSASHEIFTRITGM